MDTFLSTAGMAPAQRSTLWHRSVARTYFPLDIQFADPARFEGTIESCAMGEASLSRLRSQPLLYDRRASHLSRDGGREFLVTLPMSGEVRFSQAGRDLRCAPGGFVVERGWEPYTFGYERAADLLVLKVECDVLAARGVSAERLRSVTIPCDHASGGLFADVMRSAAARMGEMAPAARKHAGSSLVDLFCLAFVEDRDAGESGSASVRQAHRTRARTFIRRHLAREELDPAAVAAGCGISLRYLHLIFSETETSVAATIREERLQLASDLLARAGSETRISDICYRAGLADPSHFCRLFRRRFGMSPSQWRSHRRAAEDEEA